MWVFYIYFYNMKNLYNKQEYLTQDLIEQCFEQGKINYVDKVVTGNGFTYGFGNIHPNDGLVNVLVAPNQSIVKDKQNDYKAGEFAQGLRCAFVYEGSPLFAEIHSLDLIVIVADSFNNNIKHLKGNVDKLMVDEFHSVIIQSSFRKQLKKLQSILKNDFKHSSIAFVTASPLLDWDMDIKIHNVGMVARDLHITDNFKLSVNRCVESIADGGRTIIFSNSAAVIIKILNQANINTFKLIGGERMTMSLLSRGIWNLDDNSNVVVCSSAGFEGWSDYSLNGSSYIFMNPKSKHESYLGCNIYQAIGRLRKGHKYAELCVLDVEPTGFNKISIIDSLEDKIKVFMEAEDSVEKKDAKGYEFWYKPTRQNINAKEIKDYIIFGWDEHKMTMEKYSQGVTIHNERKKIKPNMNIYKEYFNERFVSFIDLDEERSHKGVGNKSNKKLRPTYIATNLKENKLEDTLDDYFFNTIPFKGEDNKETYAKEIAAYYIAEIDAKRETLSLLGEVLDERLENLYTFFTEHTGYYKELLTIVKDKIDNRTDEHGQPWTKTKKREYIKGWKLEAFPNTLLAAVGMTLNYVQHNWVASRDYNVFTTIAMPEITYVASKLGLKVMEVDIKNCFPRILYAMSGLNLPIDFYGANDSGRTDRKIRANVVINNFRYNDSSNVSKTKQKYEQKTKLTKAGYDEVVVDYLLEHFFDSEYKADVFNFLAFHEASVIRMAVDKMIRRDKEATFFRRHDSFIVFQELGHKTLDKFEYKGTSGWFSLQDNDRIVNQLSLGL